MQNGPGSPAPGSYPQGENVLGPQAGFQAKEQWLLGGDRDTRGLTSQMRANHLWRVTVFGDNVRVDISYGSAANKRLTNLRTPVRVTLPGSCDVYVTPQIILGVKVPAHAEVTCTPVSSGGGDTQCRSYIPTVGGTTNLDPDAARFVALEACTLRVGPADGTSITVTLNALDAVALIAGSALLTGGGYLEFEP